MERVIRSGQFTMGQEVAQFEREFARWVGSKHCVMVNSGSSANLLAIAALRYKKRDALRPGDEVIVPALSWSTTYYPVHQYGLRLVFVDIDQHTLNIDPLLLERALTTKTRAVLVPNILGNPAALDTIDAFCRKHDLYLIEDNCESLGATLDGRQAGTWGILGTFSSFFSHHICTMEGGMVVTDDEEIYHILLSLRAHGWTRQLPSPNRLTRKGTDPFYESFRFILPGYNVRPLELAGAIGREQVRKIDKIIGRRRKNARLFQDLFSDDDRFLIQQETGKSSWFGFSFVLQKQFSNRRAKALRILAANRIEVRPIVSGNFLRNDVIQHLDHRVIGKTPAADSAHDSGFFVGNQATPLDDQLHHLHRTLQNL